MHLETVQLRAEVCQKIQVTSVSGFVVMGVTVNALVLAIIYMKLLIRAAFICITETSQEKMNTIAKHYAEKMFCVMD